MNHYKNCQLSLVGWEEILLRSFVVLNMHVIQEPNKQVEERICIFNKIKNFLDCNSFKRSVSILLGIAETLWGDSAETQGSGE